MLSCRRNEYELAEGELRKLVATLNGTYAGEPELLASFTTAETRWGEFRDAECKLRTFDSREGTAFESYWLECLTALDQERLKALRYMVDHP